MKKLICILVLGLLLFGCERIPADVKEYCGTFYKVIEARTDRAAKYAYEGCVAEEMRFRK